MFDRSNRLPKIVAAGEWVVTTPTRSFRRRRIIKPKCPVSKSDTIHGGKEKKKDEDEDEVSEKIK